MRPLEWRESTRNGGRMLVAERGPWMKCFVWRSEDCDAWAWEVEFGSIVIDYAPTEEDAKKAAESYLRGFIQALLGDGAK